MADYKVAKFGGSSLANAEQIHKVEEIILADASRKYIVVSAPGKDKSDSRKITDQLFNIAKDGRHFNGSGISAKESYDAVVGKYRQIAGDLGIDASDIIKDLEADLNRSIDGAKRLDFYASRGEHYQAKLIGQYLQKKGMDVKVILPEQCGFYVSEDFGDARVLPETDDNLHSLRNIDGRIITPGYYGVTKGGDIAVFSRGGSDFSGGKLSALVEAVLYENWTDTDGVFQVDPRLIKEAKPIQFLTYKEIRILSTKGFSVLHYNAMLPCEERFIPINIRNTNNPSAPGTMIVSERIPTECVVGIARLDDICYLHVEKKGMDEEVGVAASLLDSFRKHHIPTHHYPTDRDDIAVYADQKEVSGVAHEIVADVHAQIHPNHASFHPDISLLVPVGIGMKNDTSVMARIGIALYRADINTEVVSKTPSGISYVIGVKKSHANKALRALYDEFFVKPTFQNLPPGNI